MNARKWDVCFQNPFLLVLSGVYLLVLPRHWLLGPSSWNPHPTCRLQILLSVMQKVQFCLRAYLKGKQSQKSIFPGELLT